MNPSVRKETPDSEALASSEDERPWPSAPSFGSLPRKENGVPGIGGGIWSTQKRGSFKMEKAAQRNAAREAHLSAPRSGLRAEGTPSPSASEGALPFAIPLQPTPKAGRSLSHSQGQRESVQASSVHTGLNEHAPVLPLGLLTEEVDTETDSELGGSLTHTTSYSPVGTLQRTTTLPARYDNYYTVEGVNGSTDATGGAQQGQLRDPKVEAAFANLSLGQSQRRTQWQSHLGWDDVPNVNESRRHSLADIPTRRGSLAGADSRGPGHNGHFFPNGLIYDFEDEANSHAGQTYRDSQNLEFAATGANSAKDPANRTESISQMKYYDQDEQGNTLEIPTMYKVPYIKIADHERSDQDKRGPLTFSNVGQWGPGPNRPRKQLYIVSFKCSRVDVFYLLDNTGLFIKEGDIVIVEADRGQDLGTVQHANVTPDDARLYKRKYGEEQYKWLMMFSKNNQQGNVNPNAQVYGENNSRNPSQLLANAPSTMQGLPRDNFNNLKPKAVKRLANNHEIRMLSEKEGNEAKAKRACQQKVQHLHLDMEILDAEWQWDFQKLIFYYYADHYINFKDLITELYRIYKTRIWLSAINPASFSQHALGQPPSGIGPGAVGNFNPQLNNTYTMTYGPDPDPYGAIPPYRIGYDTYTPNYPGIPGVANSFAPAGTNQPMSGNMTPYDTGSGDATPAVPPGVTPTGTQADYNYYYDRNASQEQTPKAFAPPNLYGSMNAPNDPYSSMYAGAPNAMPAMGGPNDRAFGFGYQPFGNGPGPSGISQGLGRQGVLPPPIGTRPHSNGTSMQAPTSNVAQYGGSNAYANQLQRGSFLNRTAPDFVPGQQAPQQMGWFARGNMAQTPEDSPNRGSWGARMGGPENMGKDEFVKNYLENLHKKDGKDSRADDMSRER